MITEKELQISNKSYINKDFQTIYPEILDIAKKLSNNWNPETSNESDPGVVLLKLLGFIGDKLNYNIDKNTLETFMPSCTQMNSMRNLCEMQGYSPKYYQSATTTVKIQYLGDAIGQTEGKVESFKLSPFVTQLTTTDTNTDVKIFTLIDACEFNAKYQTIDNLEVIEGTIQDLTINDSADIFLNNLDDNNRIYFPERMVAENGIFICKIGDVDKYWAPSLNLNTEQPGSFCYKFGFDSIKNLPYVEFPSDIGNIIGEGLRIKYIRTSGLLGNVAANKINGFESLTIIESGVQVYPAESSDESVSGDVLIVSNSSAAINGADPETIEEAYNSFKKTVGTFDTLVTCRDYANAIYNMVSENRPFVSNCQVSDRRNDYNCSTSVVTYNSYGSTKLKEYSNDITAFDLVLYPLKPIEAYNEKTYKASFEPLADTSDIINQLEDTGNTYYDNISHDYKKLNPGDVYLFKIKYALDIKISTTYKVNVFEQSQIIANIKNALYRNFNSREVDYGYEIPYEAIYNTVMQADERIKFASVDIVEQIPYVVTTEGREYDLSDVDGEGLEYYKTLCAKNILAGKVTLFDIITDFNLKFGQQAWEFNKDDDDYNRSHFIADNISSITTEVDIEITPTPYVLRENEIIQATAPKLVTEQTYGAYTYFRWTGADIQDLEEHTIAEGEELELAYTAVNKDIVRKIITSTTIETYTNSTVPVTVSSSPNIISPQGFTLRPNYDTSEKALIDKLSKNYSTVMNSNELENWYALTLEESILKRKYAEAIIGRTPTSSLEVPCYWIRNNANNALFTEDDEIKDEDDNIIGYSTILGENELFIYSNKALTSLEVIGSGNEICFYTNRPTFYNWELSAEEENTMVDVEAITNKGLSAFSSTSWKYILCNNDNFFKNTTLQIITLVEGSSISCESSSILLSNTPYIYTDESPEISYTLPTDTSSATLTRGIEWKIKSVLDINSGPDFPQTLLSNQSFVVTSKILNDETGEYTSDTFTISGVDDSPDVEDCPQVEFSLLTQLNGGKDINLSYYNIITEQEEYPLSIFTYTYSSVKIGEREAEIDASGNLVLSFKELNSALNLPLITRYAISESSDSEDTNLNLEYFMCYWDASEDTTAEVNLTGTDIMFINLNTMSVATEELHLTPGLSILAVASNKLNSRITLEVTNALENPNEYLVLGKLFMTEGINPALGLSMDNSNDLLSKINALSNGKFNYAYIPTNSESIEYVNLLDASAFYDYNNVANRMTLSQLIIPTERGKSKSTIDIMKSSRA